MLFSWCHSSVLVVKASAAASWMPRKLPLSMLLFTLRIHEINVGLEATMATRQPGMLWLLLMELNSRQQSLAPGTCRMLRGRSLRIRE